jgi:hypothetical protein
MSKPTPETDDQPIIYAINDNGYQVPCVDIEFARKLERERDAAHKIAERAIDDLAWFNYSNAQRLRAELNQLKEGSK